MSGNKKYRTKVSTVAVTVTIPPGQLVATADAGRRKLRFSFDQAVTLHGSGAIGVFYTNQRNAPGVGEGREWENDVSYCDCDYPDLVHGDVYAYAAVAANVYIVESVEVMQ